VVNPYKLAFREARSAVGGSGVLKAAEEYDSVAEAVVDCSLVIGTTAIGDRTITQPLKRLGAESAALVRARLTESRVAVLFGSEKTGLSNDDFSHCQWLLTIPTHETNISMNLGQAVAVCLYELARAEKTDTVENLDFATAETLEQITAGLLDALRISGYIKPGTDKMFEKKARQLIRQMNLEAYEAKLLLGMIRQIVWKLHQSDKR
jgi:tRNA/rRNA methyltransferase